MDESKPGAELPSWLGRSADFLLLIFCLVIFGFQISWIDDPWDNSHCGVNSGAYYGYACKGIDAFGYGEARGQGPLLFHPDGKGLFLPYTNHPGTIYTIFYPAYRYLGQNERALRIPILVILLINILILRFLLVPIIGRLGATSAAIGFASLPMMYQFGKMVDIPLFCLALFVPVVTSWLRYRAQPSKGRWFLFALLAFVAGSLDWFCYFLGPILCCDILLTRNSFKQKLRLGLLALLPFAVAFVLVFSWLLWAEGSVDQLSDTFSGLFRAVGFRSDETNTEYFIAKVSWSYWWESVTTHGSFTFTKPFLGLAALGLLASLVIRNYRHRHLRCGLMLLVAGLLPCLAFRTHASKHEFWPMVSLAGFALFFGVGIRALYDVAKRLKLSPGGIVLIALVACGSYGATSGYHFKKLREGKHDHRLTAIEMNRAFGPEDLVFTSDSLSPSRFYRNFVTVPQATNPFYFRHVLKRIRKNRGQFKRAFMLWNKSSKDDWKWLKDIPSIGELKEVSFGGSQYFSREIDINRLWDY